MIRYLLVTKNEEEKPYKISWIYYGDILGGARHTITIGVRHP
jgi:hypothetical protein